MRDNPERRNDPGYRLIDALGDSVHVALSAQRELEDVAYALGVLGSERLADRLAEIGRSVVEATKAAQAAHSQSLNHDLASSQAFTGLLLKATLEGCIASKGARP